MDHAGVERLREHLHRHNRWVLGLIVVTFLIAAALWAALYFIVWWLFLIGGTAAKSVDFQPARGALVPGFIATAVVLCLFAWIARRMHPNEIARGDKGAGGHFMDVLLAIPRLTLAAFGMGRAAARLNDRELDSAWNLLSRMNEQNKPVPMQELPVDIPDPDMRKKIVLALQLSDLIEVRPTRTGPVLAFRNEDARRLTQEKVRLRV